MRCCTLFQLIVSCAQTQLSMKTPLEVGLNQGLHQLLLSSVLVDKDTLVKHPTSECFTADSEMLS